MDEDNVTEVNVEVRFPDSANCHVDSIAFKRQYNGKQGFGTSFDDTTYSHPVMWKIMIDHPSDILVYSPPLEGVRRYDA